MWVDRGTIGQKLFAGFGALLLLTVLEASVAFWGSSRIRADVEAMTLRSAELRHILTIQTALFKIESGVKSMLWAGVDNNRPLYESSKKISVDQYELATKEVGELSALLVGEADQSVPESLRENLASWKTIHTQVLSLSDSGRFADALQILTARANPLPKVAEDSVQRISNLMTEATGEAARSHAWSRFVTVIVIALALGVGAFGVWLVRIINTSLRGMSRELGEGGQAVVDASLQMAVSARSMSQGAAEQAASLEETSASMEEIAAMTRTNADNSQQAATLMGEAARVLEHSNAALADMVGAMTSIKESSNRVSKIIKTIDEIAFQTNILALNAAVEAARAGEAGMGFAVVADEVRNLAQRSAQAAKDTTALIEQAINSSSEGNQKVGQAAESFTAITSRVSEVKRLVDTVSVASGQQAHGIEQVLQTIRQMERVTQTTAATAEESAAASEQLSSQADVTLALVQRLKTMVDSQESAAPEMDVASRRPAHGRGRTTRHSTGSQGKRIQNDAGDDGALFGFGTHGNF
jgi:methyl-accepting chemotaxis protein/methyl-accepting chemotaxis protein-1 (serine sensor receptor)